jgi:hypothetical protein
MSCIEYYNRWGTVCYGLLFNEDDESNSSTIHPLSIVIPDPLSVPINPFVKDIVALAIDLKISITIEKSAILRPIYVLSESLFTNGELIYRFGMNDIFCIANSESQFHDAHFMVPSLSSSTAWSLQDTSMTEFYSNLLFRFRFVYLVQSGLEKSKGKGKQTTISKIPCTQSNFLFLVEYAKSSVIKDFKQSQIVYNNVHTSNGGVKQHIGSKTYLSATISCPSILDLLLGYR